MARIYTRGGDRGETGLWGGTRVSKSSTRLEAIGAVDELAAAIGLALAHSPPSGIQCRLETLQPDLFALGSHLATPGAVDGAGRAGLPRLPEHRIPEMEEWIDQVEARLPPLRKFIMPGGTPAGAALHFARTVGRRAERAVVGMAAAGEAVPASLIVYLNRLSDLLFTFARAANHEAGAPEVQWLPERESVLL